MTYPLAPFELHRPGSVADAAALAAQHPGALFLAGGTDLMVNLRKRLAEPEHVISLAAVGEMRGIAEVPNGSEGGALTIGALTTMTELSSDPLVLKHLPMLAEAAGLVAGPTIRRMATLGGNLLLDTRCRYYNQSHFWRQANDFCLKKDGSVCHVAPKGSFCWAACSADTPPVLLLLEAELEIAGPDGTRRSPLAELYGQDGRWSIGAAAGGLAPGEVLARVRVPIPEAGWEGSYQKIRVRDSIDYPLAGVALMIKRANGKGGKIAGLRLALTAVNPLPVEVELPAEVTGAELTPELVDELARRANRAAKPLRTTVADPAYRRDMVGALIGKAAARLAPELGAALFERARWD